MDKKSKLKQAIELEQAIKQGTGEFVLLKKLDDLEEKIDSIKQPEKEDIEVEVEIV